MRKKTKSTKTQKPSGLKTEVVKLKKLKEEIKEPEKKVKEKVMFTTNELMGALNRSKDYLGRAQIDCMVIGKTLKSIVENNVISGDCVEFGVIKDRLTEPCWRMMRDGVKPDNLVRVKHGKAPQLKWTVDGVPVKVRILKDRKPFFGNPDTIFFAYDYFKTPNPIRAYLETVK